MNKDTLKQIVSAIKRAEGVSIGALVDQMNTVIKSNVTLLITRQFIVY